MGRRSIVVGVVVGLAGCAELETGSTGSEVIGGAPTAAGKFPGVGALMYDFGGGVPQAGCTGTLIAPDAVLTAAHCVDPFLVGDAVPGFTLAIDTTVGTPTVIAGRQAFKHEQFTIEGEAPDGLGEFFDIGVLLLAQPITEVAPVPMPRPVDIPELVAGLDLEIVGYGRTSNETQDTGVLFDATTKLVSLNATELQVGMGAPQPQNCNGDSGGPGFALVGGKRRVIGTVSRSFTGFDCTMGGVDTRVDAYLAWIHSKVPTGIPCDSGMAEACPPGTNGGDEEEDGGGCCSTGRSGTRGVAGSLALVLVVGLALGRRRRR